MLKRIVFALFALSSAALRAGAVDDAIDTAQQMQAKIGAASSIHSPSLNNYQSVQGDVSVLKPFAEKLASQLAAFNVGPASQVRSVSANLSVKIGTLQGTSALNLSAFIDSCRGVAEQADALQALLPGLIEALKNEKARALIAVQTVTQWTPPTPVPGPDDPGQRAPTPTPLPTYAIPTALPTQVYIPGAGQPGLPPTGNPGVPPGGPSLPPPPPMVSTPVAAATPTPRPTLKAPVAMLAVGESNGDNDEHAHHGKIYVANYSAGSIGVLDTGLRRFVKQIVVGSQPAALAKSGLVIVVNYGSNNASLIDSKSDAVVATLNVGSQPVDVAASDGKAYVVNQGSDSVTVIDLKNKKIAKTLKVGAQPSRVRLSGGKAYVSDTNDDSVTVIDTQIDAVTATVSE